MMDLNKARAIATEKFGMSPAMFDKCLVVAKEMEGMRTKDLGPMTLALALLGVSRAYDPEHLSAELTTALEIVAKAEREYDVEKRASLN